MFLILLKASFFIDGGCRECWRLNTCKANISSLFYFVLLGIEPEVSSVLGKCTAMSQLLKDPEMLFLVTNSTIQS